MKKNTYTTLLTLLLATTAFSQTLDWGKSTGGNGENVLRSLHMDGNGNIISAGYFMQTADFDPGMDQFNLTADGDFNDAYVQKLDNEGNFLWAKHFGGSGFDYAVSVTSDASGNVYIAGAYEGTVDFDPSAGVFNLTSAGSLDIFLVKLDAFGEFIWAKSMGGADYEEAVEVRITATGSVLIMGYYFDPFDADPGAGTQILTSQGSGDVFLINLDASGNLLEAKSFGGDGFELGMAMEIAPSGMIFITGFFDGTIDLDPSPTEVYNLTSMEFSSSGYLLVLDDEVNFMAAYSTSGGGVTPRALNVATDGAIYITGDFSDTVNFGEVNGADVILESPFTANVFVLKIDNTGELQWVNKIASQDPVFSYAIVSSSDHVFVAGFYEELTDFDPSETEQFNLQVESGSALDAYLAIYGTNGEFINAANFGGVNFLDTHKMVKDADGDLILGAQYEGTIDIDPSPTETTPMTAVAFRDSYLLKFSVSNLGIGEEMVDAFQLYPNPTNDLVHITGLNLFNTSYTIIDMLGRELKQGHLSNDQSISFSELSKGTYMLILDKKYTFKVVKN